MGAEVIQCEYDALEGIAARCGTQMDLIHDLHSRVLRTYQTLAQDGWQGRGKDAFCAEMDGEVLPAVQRLQHALGTAATVTREASAILRQAEEEAARLFTGEGHGAVPIGGGEDAAAGSTHGDGDIAPQNMQELYQLIRGGDELKQFKIGDNEYVITLNGTEFFDLFGMNGINSAVAAGLGFGGAYTQKLRAMLRDLPDGATVHLAGYSLGGIVAQNLVNEEDFLHNHQIQIGSVTTFGSPPPVLDTLQKGPDGKTLLKGIPYVEFDAAGDPVSDARFSTIMKDSNRSNLIKDFILGDENVVTNFFADALVRGGPGAFPVHTESYGDPASDIGKDMTNYTDMPFSTDNWGTEPEKTENDADMKPFSLISEFIDENAPPLVEGSIRVYNDVTDAAGETIEHGKEMAGNVLDHGGDLAKQLWDMRPRW